MDPMPRPIHRWVRLSAADTGGGARAWQRWTRLSPPLGRARPPLVACALACASTPHTRWRGSLGRAAACEAAARTSAEEATVDVVSGDPLVLVLDGLCPDETVAELRALLEQQSADHRIHTSAYVDDMFEEQRSIEEDAHLLRCVASGAVRVPREYRFDPLRSFLWAAGTSWESMPQEGLQRAQLAVARRAWQTQWDPSDVAKSGFKKAATRWKVPQQILQRLAPLVADVLSAHVRDLPGSQEALAARKVDPRGPAWVLRDSTVVRYKRGESQVPHVDTCDLTLLLYLSSSGGPTCFPALGRKIFPRAGRVLLFCSTVPEAKRFGGFADAAYGRPNDATIHYGGLAGDGADHEKLLVQLLLSADGLGSASSWREILQESRFFQTARFTSGQCSSPLQLGESLDASARAANFGVSTAPSRCAKGCVGNAVDLALEEGSPKHCIWCWNSWLERSIRSGRSEPL